MLKKNNKSRQKIPINYNVKDRKRVNGYQHYF